MANEPISQLPVATSVNGSADYTVISQYTGTPGALYQSKRATLAQVAQTFLSDIPAGGQYFIFGGGVAIQAGVAPGYFEIPFNATITAAQVLGDISGSCSIDIWRCSYTQFDGGITHPVAADSITGGNPLVITASVKGTSTLSNWTTALNSGDILAFNVQSTSSFKNLTIILTLDRSLS